MGNQSTKRQGKVGYFSAEEITQIKSVFNSLSSQKGPCSPSVFQKHCEKHLDDWLALKLSEKFRIPSDRAQKGADAYVISVPHVIEFLSCVFMGSIEEKVKCVWEIALSNSSDTRPQISDEEISRYARTVIESYLKCMETTRQSSSWTGSTRVTSNAVEDLSNFLLLELFHEGVPPKEILQKKQKKSQYTMEDLCRSFSKNPLLLNLHSSVFSQCFSFNQSQYVLKLIPHCIHPHKHMSPEEFTILDLTQILFLNSQIPSELRNEWRYLFSTKSDGESFSKFMGAIQDKGPTIIVIKDENGYVFGAFTDESWATGPKFFGSEKCFLFHLSPRTTTYTSTGFNQNFQYLNVQQQTMPNGLGIGGKLDYFGLYLSSDFGHGKCSPSCTTFSSPQLSLSEDFKIHTLEVWGIGPEPQKEEGQRDPKSILDKDPEAKAILEIMNKGNYSDGYRDKKKSYEEEDDD